MSVFLEKSTIEKPIRTEHKTGLHEWTTRRQCNRGKDPGQAGIDRTVQGDDVTIGQATYISIEQDNLLNNICEFDK